MLMNAIEKKVNERKSFTENGALAYETAGKAILDFNFALAGYRGEEVDTIMKDFAKVFYSEGAEAAIRYLFYVGDIREGAGERKAFRAGLRWLAKNQPEMCKAVIPFVGEYNRFDSLLSMLDTDLRKDVTEYLRRVITDDYAKMERNEPISLCAKWCPSENASSPKTKRYAKILIEDFGITARQYRKTLSELRKYLDVVEVKMSAKRWGEINYETVPSRANLIYNPAFLRNDEERRRAYLESLKKGETKINAGVLQPHEIVASYFNKSYWREDIRDYDETLEQLWKNLPNKTVDNVLVIRDGSGSMESSISGKTTCLDVATALAIYMSERNTGEWKDKFITFSSNPEVVDLSKCETLRDKIKYCSTFDDCSNTNLYATMILILEAAVANNIPQEDMPETICCLSDMQFDGRRFNLNKTLFEDIIDEFNRHGYKMPRLCFWNINDRGEKTVPLQQNEIGLILCSGFSVQIMNMFLSNKLDPYEVLMEQVNSPRYDAVAEAIKA